MVLFSFDLMFNHPQQKRSLALKERQRDQFNAEERERERQRTLSPFLNIIIIFA